MADTKVPTRFPCGHTEETVQSTKPARCSKGCVTDGPQHKQPWARR